MYIFFVYIVLLKKWRLKHLPLTYIARIFSNRQWWYHYNICILITIRSPLLYLFAYRIVICIFFFYCIYLTIRRVAFHLCRTKAIKPHLTYNNYFLLHLMIMTYHQTSSINPSFTPMVCFNATRLLPSNKDILQHSIVCSPHP